MGLDGLQARVAMHRVLLSLNQTKGKTGGNAGVSEGLGILFVADIRMALYTIVKVPSNKTLNVDPH